MLTHHANLSPPTSNIMMILMLSMQKPVHECPLLSMCLFHLGHSAYLGFFYMDYCYNNAVIHVFLGSLAQAITPHHSKDSGKAAEEMIEFKIIDSPTPAADVQLRKTPMTSE